MSERVPIGKGKKYKWLKTEKGRAYIKRHNANGKGAKRMRQWRKNNREKYLAQHREQMQKWRNTPKGKRTKKNGTLKKLYGITIEQFEALVQRQGGKCAICAGELDMGFRTHVDHCHTTGVVRGLLCSPCNTSLGCFKDSVEILRRAIDYLEQRGG